MKRTITRMADGRQLIYFDETDDAVRDAVDRRDLPPLSPASRMRYDPLTDEWITIASHRQTRTFLPPADECPLCPSTPDRLTEIPDSSYDVVVFENRFPSFSEREGSASGPPDGPPDRVQGVNDGEMLPGLNPVRAAQGRCEVVCFTSDHNASFGSLSPQRVHTVLEVLADRTATLATIPGVEQVFCFENRGVEIGVTLHHPHGQIYAYPFVAPRTRTMLAAARRHAQSTGGRNLFADVLAGVRANGDRVVTANEHWTAFVPAAARWPFEVLIAPHRQVADLPGLSDAEALAFGPVYLDVLRRFDGLFDAPMPYISAWHQAPVRTDRDLAYLHLQLFSVRRAPGKLKYLAGSESAMGAFVNDVVPEEAARMLRYAGAA
jgi:UDPglucose--hexose-1-phosphate uridylyltransferase